MRWEYEYTENFVASIRALRHEYQRAQIRLVLQRVKSLGHPKDSGAEYMGNWAYVFAEKCLLQCEIDEKARRVYFLNVVM